MKLRKKNRARNIAVREVKKDLRMDGWEILGSMIDDPGPVDLLVGKDKQFFLIHINHVVYPMHPKNLETDEKDRLKRIARRYKAFPARADVRLFSDLRLRELTYRSVR